MDNNNIVESLLQSVRQLVQSYEKYTSGKRCYTEGEPLFMREAHLIIAVGNCPGASMSDVARALDVTPGAVSQLAMRMEKKGFITRVCGAEDKRQAIIRLTDKGKQFYEDHREFDRQKHQELAQRLSQYAAEDLTQCIALHQVITDLLDTASGEKQSRKAEARE